MHMSTRLPDTSNRPLSLPDQDQTGVGCLSMANLTYHVHVGCHLDCYVVVQLGINVQLDANRMGTYGMSSADPVGDSKKGDEHGRRWHTHVCGHGRYGRVRICRHGCYRRQSYEGADMIAEKTVNQKLDFVCRVTFVSGRKKNSYINSFTSLVNCNSSLLNKLHIEL